MGSGGDRHRNPSKSFICSTPRTTPSLLFQLETPFEIPRRVPISLRSTTVRSRHFASSTSSASVSSLTPFSSLREGGTTALSNRSVSVSPSGTCPDSKVGAKQELGSPTRVTGVTCYREGFERPASSPCCRAAFSSRIRKSQTNMLRVLPMVGTREEAIWTPKLPICIDCHKFNAPARAFRWWKLLESWVYGSTRRSGPRINWPGRFAFTSPFRARIA